MQQTEWKIGQRVVYTSRSGKKREGVVRDVTQISTLSGCMLDLKLDGDSRSRFYVPEDMVSLIQEEPDE